MSNGINRATIIGRLGQDPEIRYMPNGVAVANITVATSKSWKDKQTGEKREKVEWHRVTAVRRTAEVMGEYLKKGSQVYIEGELQTRKWQDKDGVDKYTTEILCNTMQMLDSKGSSDSQPANAVPDQGGFDDSSDIPFANPYKYMYYMV